MDRITVFENQKIFELFMEQELDKDFIRELICTKTEDEIKEFEQHIMFITEPQDQHFVLQGSYNIKLIHNIILYIENCPVIEKDLKEYLEFFKVREKLFQHFPALTNNL